MRELVLDPTRLENSNKGSSGPSSPLKRKRAFLTGSLSSSKRPETVDSHVNPLEPRPQVDLRADAGNMGLRDSPRREEGEFGPLRSDRHAQRSPKRYSSDRQTSSYNDSHGVRDSERRERRSRSPERGSPISANRRYLTNHDLIPGIREEIRSNRAAEWNSLSPADRDRERRTKEAEEYMVSRGFKPANPVSRHYLDDRSKQRGKSHFFMTTLSVTACQLKSTPSLSLRHSQPNICQCSYMFYERVSPLGLAW